MNYPVKCTACALLLRNLKTFSKAHFYLYQNEWYIDVQDERVREIIKQLEWHQSRAHEKYKDLEFLTDKNETS